MALEIDLHGYKHKDAIVEVENTLIMNSLTRVVDYKIITGNSPKLQEKLIKLFDNYNFSYYIPAHNQGEIYVSYNEIL